MFVHYNMDIREQLKTLPFSHLKSLAKLTNLHFHIPLKSKKIVIEGLARLYEYENGIYKSKSFQATINDGNAKTHVIIKRKHGVKEEKPIKKTKPAKKPVKQISDEPKKDLLKYYSKMGSDYQPYPYKIHMSYSDLPLLKQQYKSALDSKQKYEMELKNPNIGYDYKFRLKNQIEENDKTIDLLEQILQLPQYNLPKLDKEEDERIKDRFRQEKNYFDKIKDPDQKNTKFKSDKFGLVEDSVIKLVKTFMNYKNNKQDIYMTPYKKEIVKTFWNLYSGDRLFRDRINRYTKKNNIEFDLYDI